MCVQSRKSNRCGHVKNGDDRKHESKFLMRQERVQYEEYERSTQVGSETLALEIDKIYQKKKFGERGKNV